MATRPVTDEDRQRVREMHAAGATRNDIARAIGRGGATVSKIALSLGLTFDRGDEVRAATEARVADAKAKRAALMVALLDDAQKLRARLWQPCKVYDWGGKDHDYDEREHPEPDATAKLKLMQATGIAIDRSLRLEEHDNSSGVDAAKSMLGSLALGLGAAYAQIQQASDDGR